MKQIADSIYIPCCSKQVFTDVALCAVYEFEHYTTHHTATMNKELRVNFPKWNFNTIRAFDEEGKELILPLNSYDKKAEYKAFLSLVQLVQLPTKKACLLWNQLLESFGYKNGFSFSRVGWYYVDEHSGTWRSIEELFSKTKKYMSVLGIKRGEYL